MIYCRWSKKLTSFERSSANNSDEGVLLRFNDASEYNVSLLVGADGVFSTVYQLMLHRNDQLRRSASQGRARDTDGAAMLVEDPMRLKYLGLMVVLGISPLSSSLLSSSGSTAMYTPAQAWLGQRQWLDGSTRVFTMPFDATKTMWQLSFPMDEGSAMELSTAATTSSGKDTSSPQVDRLFFSSTVLVTIPPLDGDPCCYQCHGRKQVEKEGLGAGTRLGEGPDRLDGIYRGCEYIWPSRI